MAVGVGILVVFPIGNTKEGGKSPCGRLSGARTAGTGAGAAGGGELAPGGGEQRGNAETVGLQTLQTSEASSSGTKV